MAVPSSIFHMIPCRFPVPNPVMTVELSRMDFRLKLFGRTPPIRGLSSEASITGGNWVKCRIANLAKLHP